ncbi:MAG: transglycosylase SLT domain-containing protein [Proteobacteria bacterium]|nr:transglycosylase SLT domain-containing protein [Pseudomonadota bacterium]
MSLVTALKAPLSIANAIRKASRATGVDFSYLLNTAARESSFNQSAKAKTSSAAGLFQFIENTWLKTVKETGDKFGLGKYTAHIFKTRSGRHYVPNAKLRTELLKLRNNPEISALMAGAFTQRNSEIVASHLGRKPSDGELYIAHFLGPKGASELISLAENNPNARASRHFPRAARANKPIFYSRGRSRTVAQVYKELVGDHVKQQALAAATVPVAANPATVTVTKAIFTKPVTQHAPVPVPERVPARLYTASILPASANPVPVPERVPARLYTASISLASANPVALESRLQPSHADKSYNGATANKPTGLLGQTRSPIGAMTKVAALTGNSLQTAPATMTDAAPGSIGIWTTIIRYPTEQVARTEPSLIQDEKEALSFQPRAARRANGSQPARLLEQSAKRHARHAALRTASPPDVFNTPEFWDRMAEH